MGNIILYSHSKYKKTGGDNMCTILEKIRNKTPDDLLKEYRIEQNPPINISMLIKNIGISLIAKDFTSMEKQHNHHLGSILGAAISKGNSLAIFYKNSDTYNRKIFTIAHELGHCCLHSDNLKISHLEFRTKSNILEKHEVEANIFAGELLIPEKVLLEKYKEFYVPSLKVLSNIFCVSTNVMAARLDYLNLDYFKDININEE